MLSSQDVVRSIENQAVDENDRPKSECCISHSAEMIPAMKNDKGEWTQPTRNLSDVAATTLPDSCSKKRAGSPEPVASVSSPEASKEKKKKHKKEKREKKEKKKKKRHKSVHQEEPVAPELVKQPQEEPPPAEKFYCTVDPDDVPAIPTNKFLYRGSKQDTTTVPAGEQKPTNDTVDSSRESRAAPSYRSTRDGGVVKGRGSVRYVRSGGTPPHWRSEERRLVSISEFERRRKVQKR